MFAQATTFRLGKNIKKKLMFALKSIFAQMKMVLERNPFLSHIFAPAKKFSLKLTKSFDFLCLIIM